MSASSLTTAIRGRRTVALRNLNVNCSDPGAADWYKVTSDGYLKYYPDNCAGNYGSMGSTKTSAPINLESSITIQSNILRTTNNAPFSITAEGITFYQEYPSAGWFVIGTTYRWQ